MERGDFGLIVLAATTGSFDFTQRNPYYYTNLRLAINSLRRKHRAYIAAQHALHCVISILGTTGESRETNVERLNTNNNLMAELLGLKDILSYKTDRDLFIETWEKLYGNTQQQETDTDST